MLSTTYLKSNSIVFTEEHMMDFADILLDCYNGSAGNPVIMFFMDLCKFSCKEIDDGFVFYIALARWPKLPFTKLLERSNINRDHWANLYMLYKSNKYKKRSTKLKKMFLYLAGIKFDY